MSISGRLAMPPVSGQVVVAQLRRNPEIKNDSTVTVNEKEIEAGEIEENKTGGVAGGGAVFDVAVWTLVGLRQGSEITEDNVADLIWREMRSYMKDSLRGLKFKDNESSIKYTEKEIDALLDIFKQAFLGKRHSAISKNYNGSSHGYISEYASFDRTLDELLHNLAFKNGIRVVRDEDLGPFVQKVKGLLLKNVGSLDLSQLQREISEEGKPNE